MDNGVGMQACGPLGCPACYWIEGDPVTPHAVRCVRSTDGTVATASEIYVDGRLFLAADHPDRALNGLVRTEELRQLAIRTRDEAYACARAALDARWTWWGRNGTFIRLADGTNVHVRDVCGLRRAGAGWDGPHCGREPGHDGCCAFREETRG